MRSVCVGGGGGVGVSVRACVEMQESGGMKVAAL